MSPKTVIERVWNFSAGPAVLPVPVLEQIQQDLLALPGCGASILEISHRSEAFAEIQADAKQRLRTLLNLPDDYRILFLQGGSRLQFSMVPMNLIGNGGTADYLLTGSWGKKALDEAKKVGPTRVPWDGQSTGYDRVPHASQWSSSPDATYVHITSNETIEGVQFPSEPDTDGVVVCDASSDFLSRPLVVKRFGLIYACAQKNAGPAGLTIVLIRDDLLERSRDDLPGYLNYRAHAEQDSLYNTPCTFGIYTFGLVARWLQEEIGGLAEMAAQNAAKSALLYEAIDASPDFYTGHAQPGSRSSMNVTFRLPNDELQAEFLRDAARRQLESLQGHRSVGGIRASIYNAMPLEGVVALRDFMIDFRDRRAE